MPETQVFSTAAVAAPHPRAAEIGQTILASGGNAIEAVVAMAATCAVVLPHLNALGGDGLFLVREPRGRVHALEALGPAGSLATIERYRTKEYPAVPRHGPDAAVTVAGVVAGWSLGLELSRALGGTMPLDMLLADAIRLARNGYPVSSLEERASFDAGGIETPHFAETFLVEGRVPEAGSTRCQARLAETLAHLSHAGLMDFYRGDVGREIAFDLARIGSPITRGDMENFRARVAEPLCLQSRGASVYALPAPSQGLVPLIARGIADRLALPLADRAGCQHGLIEATKRALAWRDILIADPREMDHDIGDCLSGAFLARETARIDLRRAADASGPPFEGDGIWIGCVDATGLAVSYSQSVYGAFGSGCVLPRTGVLWNSMGSAFSLDPADRSRLIPGRRPRHTLNPSLAVLPDNRILAFGAADAQTQAQIFSHVTDLGMGVADALAEPRWSLGTGEDRKSVTLGVEDHFDTGLARALRRLGHDVAPIDGRRLAHAGMVVKHPRNGRTEAAHDSRGDGVAMGL